MDLQRRIAATFTFAFALALCSGPAAVGEDAEKRAAELSEVEPSEAEPSEAEPSEVEPSEAEPSEAEPSEARQTRDGRLALSYWLLEEFDWGDDEEVVAESILFDPYYSCNGMRAEPCLIVSTVIDGEKLLAHFHHRRRELWQVVLLTPDLDLAQANAHIPRVWRILVDYVTRMKGEPIVAVGLPDFDSLALSPPQPTHFWAVDDLEVRVMVGRRDTDRFYVGAFFSDPVRGKLGRAMYEIWLANSDARKRNKWAAEKSQRLREERARR